LFKPNIFVQAVNIYLRDIIYLVKLLGEWLSIKAQLKPLRDLKERIKSDGFHKWFNRNMTGC